LTEAKAMSTIENVLHLSDAMGCLYVVLGASRVGFSAFDFDLLEEEQVCSINQGILASLRCLTLSNGVKGA
jgi:hypothetical protein